MTRERVCQGSSAVTGDRGSWARPNDRVPPSLAMPEVLQARKRDGTRDVPHALGVPSFSAWWGAINHKHGPGVTIPHVYMKLKQIIQTMRHVTLLTSNCSVVKFRGGSGGSSTSS